MLICINNTDKRSVRLRIPMSTTLEMFIVKRFILAKLSKGGIKLLHKQKKLISKSFKENRKMLKGWKLVEVESTDGEKIDIYL